MINEVEILKELDERIELQGIIVEHSYTGNRSGNAAYEQGRFDEIKALRDFIKTKSAHGAATPMSTDINSLTQRQYNTDQKKSKIRKTATEIFNLSLQLQEMTDGTIDWIDWREPGVPCVYVEYHGATAVLSVKIWENGFSAEQRPDYSTMLFLDNPNCMIEAGYPKEKLMGLLEERRGSDNGKDDSDHN